MDKNADEKYMHQCITLAKRGRGKVSPNPMVGCVVLDRKGNVVSTGYHHKYGDNHAERDALLKLKNNEARGGTLYVNLEPCSHYGKTPPCADLIIKHGLRRVVIGMKDVNPKVNSIKKLEDAGIEVCVGVLERESKFLNRVFIKNMTKELPYVILKTATTMDGKIATAGGDSKWITSVEARECVYKIRKEFDCIMTSANTVIADNPKMEHPFKCILDKDSRITNKYQIFSQGEIFIANSTNTPIIKGHLDIQHVLKTLYKKGICSVFVECGGVLAGALLKEGLIDEVYQFIAPKILNDNNGKSCFDGDCINKISDVKNLNMYAIKKVGSDILVKSIVE